MKKYILILLVISNITMLSANENISVELICSKTKDIVIKINSDKLNLTNDAIQDNLGGYVDIPATNYYIKTNNKLYHLNGVVDNLNQDNINQFSSIINTNSKNLINPKQLYSLKNNEDLKFIQKIDLESNNNTESLKNITTTNIIKVYFDKKIFEKEYKKCEEKTSQVKENSYFQTILLFIKNIF